MLSSYRALLARSGARPLALGCALAWLSFSGYTLGIILAVHAASGSFAVAGGVVAAFSVGSGLGAPARGRVIDRRGPSSLRVFAAIHCSCAAVLVGICLLRGDVWLLVACGGLAGVVAPPLIATARALWPQVAGAELAVSAHALNAALADASQLLSPALVGTLAALLSPAVALAALIVGPAAAAVTIVRAGHGRALTSAERVRSHRVWGVLLQSSGLRTLVACDVAIGLWTGAFEVAVTAVAAHSGAAPLGALPLSVSAAGSVVVSLWAGTGRLRRPPAWRYLAGCCIVAAALPLVLLAPSIAGIAAIAVIVGAGFGLLGVALFELLDQVVAADRAVEAFTWLTTANAAGVAAGAALAGQLTHTSESAALLLVCGGAALAAGIAIGRRATLTPRDDSAQPRPDSGRPVMTASTSP